MHKAFSLPVMEFPLPREVPTASEESSHCQKKRDATTHKIALLLMSSSNCQSKSYDSYAKLVPYVTPCILGITEVIKFGDSYEVPANPATTGTSSDGTGKKKGRTVTLTADDMQKRKNDVKARTTLLLSLPDEHQLRFSKNKTTQELWAVILKTFGGNEATKKTKKNILKQQYGNFKADGSETLEQTFNRLQVIFSQLQFMDVEIEHDDLNQKFFTSLAPEWLMHMIVWRNRSDLDTMSLDDLYNHLKVYESEVQKKSKPNSQNMAFISLAKHSRGNEEVNIVSVSTASTNVSTASANNGIDEDDIKEMDIKWNMALLSIRADRFWKKTGKKISIQGTDVTWFDKSKVVHFNSHKMGHFVRECRALRSQDRGRRDNYRQGSKVEEQAPKALMAIDGVGWYWSFMTNAEENHALIADEETLTEFALMAKTNAESENMIYHYKLALAQVEARQTEFRNQELKYCKKIRVLEFKTESSTDCIKNLKKELEIIKKEKEGLDSKLEGFQTASKGLDNLLKSQRLDKNKEGLGYNVVPPHPAQKKGEKGASRSQNNTHKSFTPRPAVHKPYRPPMRPIRSNMNVARPYRTSFNKPAHSYTKRPFQGTSAVRSQYRAPWGPSVNRNFPSVNRKFSTVNRKFPTANRKFPPGSIKFSTTDMGNKGKAIKASAFAKASANEGMLWHRRLGHLNFKTMIRLVRRNLVRGLPSKCFENDHTCTAFLKGKQHKASCKSKLVNSVTKPFHTLHMDLFGPTSEMDDFCLQKGIKREFSNVRTPQQNGVAERRNKTLIEAARTMLADAKLPVTFWAEAVNTTCYVQNRVLKNKKDERGIVIRNKAMLVAQGYTQKEGIDYDEVFAHVARIKAIRLFLAYASFMGFIVYQMDVKSAFLYGTIDEEVSANTLMDKENPWGKDETRKDVDLHHYRSMIGSLMYLTASRPDITFDIIVATSTTEPEYVAAASCCRQVMWIQNQLLDYGDCFEKKLISVDHIHTDENVADLLTKPFDAKRHVVLGWVIGTSKYWGVLRILMISLRLIPLEAAKFVGDFKSIANEADESLAKHKALELEIERLLKAVISQDIMIIVQKQSVVDTSYLQTEFKRTKERFKNCIIKKETEYAKLWNDWYKKCDECKYDKISYDKAYNDMQQKIEQLQAQLGDLKGKSKDTSCVSDTRNPLFQKLENENVELEFQVLNYARENAHLKATYKKLFDFISVSRNLKLLTNFSWKFLATVRFRNDHVAAILGFGDLQQYTKRARIAQSSALPPVADEHASPLRDVSQGEACPTGSSLDAKHDRANKAKTSTFPHESTSRIPSLAADEDAQEVEITMLKARVKLLEDRERGGAERSGDDALIKGRSGSIPTAGPPAVEVPTRSDVVPTAGLIFATAIVVTPYTRRKGKETIVESETPKKKKVQEQIDAQVARELEEQMAREDQRMSEQIAKDVEIARIHAEEELQIMIDGLDMSNETVAKYLPEYHQFAKFPLERRIELISDMVRYQDNYAMIKNLIPMGSKEEAERFKRKGIRFEQESVKKLKTSEEVHEEVKTPDEVPKEKVKEMMQLVPIKEVYVEALQVKYPFINWKVHTEGQRSYWKITRLGGSSASYQFFMDLLKHLDREDLNRLWALEKETLNIRPASIEWKLYDSCGVHHVTSKDNAIFMLIEKDYSLRKGLAIVMINYKLQVENYSQMAFPLPVIEFPLPEEVPTASEESSHCQQKRDATAQKIALLLKSSSNCQSKSYDSYAKLVPHVTLCILGIIIIVTSGTRTPCPIKGVL
uniref:Integrase catalytic domain-containing protein n=1 Tax=Tanacetum cinerariifolium TaxID=118510 RepID=A0A6L2MVJ8_TANCI|nr:hypothetical protein [Tanacetum cinerariifolium]